MRESVMHGVRDPFRALVTTFVPEAKTLSDEAWSRGESIVESSLARRSASVRRQVRLLVRALDVYARLRWGRRLARVPQRRRLALLNALQGSRILLLRRGIWGLRTLAFLLFYGRPEIHPSLGYEARAGGWRALDGASAPHGSPRETDPDGTPGLRGAASP